MWKIVVLAIFAVSPTSGQSTLRLANLDISQGEQPFIELTIKPFKYSLRGNLGLTGDPTNPSIFNQCPGNASSEDTVCLTQTYKNKSSTIMIQHHMHESVECFDVIHENPPSESKDCYEIGSSSWYGGGEVLNQRWPMTNEARPRTPYVPCDFLSHSAYGGLLENLWFNSDAFSLFVDRQTPLFVTFNDSSDGKICFSASYDEYPYTVVPKSTLKILKYTVCAARNVLEIFQFSANANFKKPEGVPEAKMLSLPIWSTWVKYKAAVNQSLVLEFAREIQERNFSGQIEIDDMWESCYGQLEFHPHKFPDPGSMVKQLKAMGFRVSLWIHPFTNVFCDAYNEGSSKNYYVRNSTTGKTQKVKWWDGYGGYLDPTNPEAVEWFFQRVQRIRQDYDFDTFKFDAGEVCWNDQGFDFANQEIRKTPAAFSTFYAEMASRFGNGVEVRVGYNAQNLPIFARMLDKSSNWGYDNGLKSIIPTTLLFGVSGYPFVLPDMIGGNNYGGYPEKELFIRWLQANVFLPAVQFSILPWDYDEETVSISSKMVKLHEEYTSLFVKLANASVGTGYPIVRPLWWVVPEDPNALLIDSEYLLGNDLLVAPVLEKGARTRDIYLIEGSWKDGNNPNSVVIGPGWIRNYQAGLSVLPYFTRVKKN